MYGAGLTIINTTGGIILKAESTSNRKTRNQVDSWGCYITFKNSELTLFLFKSTAGIEMEKIFRERRFSDQYNLEFILRVSRPDPITNAMV